MPGIQSSRDKEKMTSYIMGIDIGTTSVKVCLINSITREVIHKNVKVNRVSVCHTVIVLTTDYVDVDILCVILCLSTSELFCCHHVSHHDPVLPDTLILPKCSVGWKL